MMEEYIAHLKDQAQISEETRDILARLSLDQSLQGSEHELLNPTEAAAVLSVKYRRPINHRYIKEITREQKNKDTGHITPARLRRAKMAGRTNLYKLADILSVELREKTPA